LEGIDNNLQFLESAEAEEAYAQFGDPTIPLSKIKASLESFRELLAGATTPRDLRVGLQKNFMLFRSKGRDGKGTVRFTGYFQPVYEASRKRTDEFQFPIFTKPDDFSEWSKPHPTRVRLEGYDGRGGMLRGREIAYLSSRYEAFMIQVQGSAILELTDGSQIAVGYAAGTDYRFRGVSKSYLKSKKVQWTALKTFFEKNPDELDAILAQNNRFIFFKQNVTPAPIGSLGVPVIAERSIATDKVQLPPGAIGVIRTDMPVRYADGSNRMAFTTKLVLDQDTGSAIKGPGRVDIFMGTGADAQRKANSIFGDGELYYLVLRE